MADNDASAIRLYLALLLSPRPVTLATCGEWAFATFADHLRILTDAAERGWVTEASTGRGGQFQWADYDAVDEIFAAAGVEDFGSVFDALGFGSWGLDTARTAAQSGDFPRARVLYRALVVGLPADPEFDHAHWLEVVLEALRLFRREVNWLSEPLQNDAYEIAVQLGNVRAEAVLLATRAYEQLRCGRGEGPADGGNRPAGWCERALKIAAQLDDPETRQHVLLYVANNWILLGRLREALSMLESFLGDVPQDLLAPHSGDEVRDTVTEASLSTLANAYAWTGKGERALQLLHRMVEVGTESEQPVLRKMGKIYLAWYYADRNDLEQARAWAEGAMEELEPNDARIAYGWFASQPMAWVRMKEGRLDDARRELEAGLRSRASSGHTHFQNSYLLEVLRALDDEGGDTFDREIDQLLLSPDRRMRGVAHRFRAEQLAAEDKSGGAIVDRHLQRSLELLRASGAVPELLRALQSAVAWAEERGREDEARHLREQLSDVDQLGSTEAGPAPGADARESHVTRVILDMGRLTQLAHRREGFFGEITARICRELEVERCALIDTTSSPRVLGARGGNRAWLEELQLVAGVQRDQTSVHFRPPLEGDDAADRLLVDGSPAGGGSDQRECRGRSPLAGQLVLIPYRIEDLGRHGWICLENTSRVSLVGPQDRLLLESLGVQMSVLIGNVELWEELSSVRQRLERENRYHREESPIPTAQGRMVGDSAEFRTLFELIGKIAPTQSTVLVLGETGVGKELVAHEIHRLSQVRSGPFIAVHVASMPQGLVASALFGHERGAFTGATARVRGRFELAHGGTIFLDEIGELGLEDQVRLLRVLQEGAFERVGGTKTLQSNFRLLVATNRDLDALVAEGRFREDLYYRLKVFPIRVPPLRERRSDIPRLALHFMERFARRTGREFDGIGEADVDRMLTYDWPGNIRELEHVIERAVVLSEPPMLKISQLDGGGGSGRIESSEGTWVTLEAWERRYVQDVLNHTGGRITGKGGAAALLGLKPSTLHWKIDKLGLRDALGRARGRKGS